MKNKTKTYRSAEINAEVDKVVQSIQGLTKREYFAAMALSGMLANPEYTKISEARDLRYLVALARENPR